MQTDCDKVAEKLNKELLEKYKALEKDEEFYIFQACKVYSHFTVEIEEGEGSQEILFNGVAIYNQRTRRFMDKTFKDMYDHAKERFNGYIDDLQNLKL